MRYLVTGGAGFLGSHLCASLLANGDEVICLDNFFTGRKSNLNKLQDFEKFEILRHDITEPIKVEVDRIFNLACPASPVHYQHNPIKTIKTNILGAMHTLGLAKRLNARILQASTSEIYGNPLQHPQKESYWGNVNTIGPRSCYDEGKRAAETLFMDYYNQNGVDTRIIRIFNTYGPNMLQDDGRVVSNFIVQALKGEDITIYGDGSQTRSFCYVGDLIRGMRLLMDTKGLHEPVNIGNPSEFTMLELAGLVLSLTGSKSKVIHKNLPIDDPLQRKPDISLAKANLNWEPRIELEEGLQHTIGYFIEQLKGEFR